ncbi:MAG: VCBS repeat-containing protein [Myxococcales bacterium]|nr:VCBS repeat-containing protein [Myxococcales bacterium]
MRPSICVALLCMGLAGCGDASTGTLPRTGTGGSGGTVGPDGGIVFGCNCPFGQECSPQGLCTSICGDQAACVFGGTAQCCGDGTVCQEGRCVTDCGGQVECNGVCCESMEMCFDGACVAQCDDPLQLCGDDDELCCASGEGCIGRSCVPLRNECTFSEDCEIDELCEPSLGVCIARDSVDVCEYRPPVGDFVPTVACRWTPPEAPAGASAEATGIASMSDVVMTPSVANLTDDNGDGATDVFDIPDIVFVSFNRTANGCCTSRGVLRVVSGACSSDGTMVTHATLKGLDAGDWVGNSSGVALGNLHPDDLGAERVPEIVATFKNGGTIAWRRTADDGSAWEVMWQNDELPNNQHTRGGAQPSIADLNGDGRPEVIIGNVVLDGPTGKGPNDADLPAAAIAWDGRDLESSTPQANLGIGNNAFLGPVSTVADLDRDGLQEVIAGNTVYGYDGSERWTYEYSTVNSSCGGSLDCDGYNAVGDFDDDEDGEVVIIRQGELFVLNHDGSPVNGIPLPIRIPGAPADVSAPTYSPAAYVPSAPLYDEDGDLLPPERILCGGALHLPAFDSIGNPIMSAGSQVVVDTAGANESGPPTVADFDGDGFAEVGTASSTAYVLFDFQCTGDPLPAECEREWVRWMVENDDCSSRATGSSVFDFEGDGSAEVVYADETTFRIFRGSDGAILYEDSTHSSNTRVEMPIVVDVDNDGKSEVVIPEPNTNPGLGGIEIWEDAENNWVRTRRIWNQHGYSVTNVTEDGQIPRVPTTNWTRSRLNNFRQNVQPGGLFDAPDFVVREISRLDCDETEFVLAIVVGNDGSLSVPPGILTQVFVTSDDGRIFDLGTVATSQWLLPGQSEQLEVVFSVPDGPSIATIVVSANADEDGVGGQQYNECNEENNRATSNPLSCPSVE